MPKHYSVGFFVDWKGNIPVQEYLLDDKNAKDLSVNINVIQRLAIIGQYILETKMAKRIDETIYELIKDRHRILYCQDEERFVLLCAFLKDTQKTPPKQIDLAYKNLKEYIETGNFFEIIFPPD